MPWWPGEARPATSSRPWPSPRPWWRGPRPWRASSSSDSARGQDARHPGRAGFPLTLLPGRGIVRSLAPEDLVYNAPVGRASWSWPWCGAIGRGGPGPSPGRGGGRRLRQPGRAGGAVRHRVSRGAGQRRRRPRCRQSALRPVRPGQRRGLAGNSLPVPWDRHPGAARDRRGRPAPERPGAARRALGLPGRPPAGGRRSAGPRGPADQPGRDWAWPTRWADRADRAIYHVVGRRDWAATLPTGRPRVSSDAGRRRPGRTGPGPGGLRGPHGRGLRRRRRRGVPGGGDDGGRAGGGRRARRAGAAARRPRRPPDGQRPGAGRAGAAVLLADADLHRRPPGRATLDGAAGRARPVWPPWARPPVAGPPRRRRGRRPGGRGRRRTALRRPGRHR